MDFKTFIDTGWADHADDSPAVAERVAQSLHLVTSPEHVVPFARLATHVFGEHLARWNDGVALLESLKQSKGWDGSPQQASAVVRNVAALGYCNGVASGGAANAGALEGLSVEDAIAALAVAATALVTQKMPQAAMDAYARATALAEANRLPADSPAIRALAVGGNNLAAELSGKPQRDSLETACMVAAARGGLTYWKLAGTWLEEERAEYMLSSCLRLAGDAAGATQHAERCIAICAAHDAPAFERFFGHAVLAMARREAKDMDAFDASRAEALRWHAQIDPAEQAWCATDLAALTR